MSDWKDQLCEIAECRLCDDDGLRLNGLYKCDHIDYGTIAKRGIARVQAALAEAKKC